MADWAASYALQVRLAILIFSQTGAERSRKVWRFLRRGFTLLWTNFPTQDLKANEPRLREINKVADDLLFEKLLTPEGAQIRQVSKAPSTFPHCQTELGGLHFASIHPTSYSTDQLGQAEDRKLASGKVKMIVQAGQPRIYLNWSEINHKWKHMPPSSPQLHLQTQKIHAQIHAYKEKVGKKLWL